MNINDTTEPVITTTTTTILNDTNNNKPNDNKDTATSKEAKETIIPGSEEHQKSTWINLQAKLHSLLSKLTPKTLVEILPQVFALNLIRFYNQVSVKFSQYKS